MLIIMFIIGFLLGLFFGALFTKALLHPKYCGVLVIHKPDSKHPADLYLQLEEEPEEIYGSDYVSFKVKKIRK